MNEHETPRTAGRPDPLDALERSDRRAFLRLLGFGGALPALVPTALLPSSANRVRTAPSHAEQQSIYERLLDVRPSSTRPDH